MGNGHIRLRACPAHSTGLSLGETAGARIRKKFVGSTRAEVQKRLTAALNTQQTGGIVPLQKDTIGGFLKRWLDGLRARGRREKTIDSYKWVVEKYVEPKIGNLPLTKFNQRDLNDFMKAKLEDGLSNRSVRYCHAIIRSALTTAEKEGLVSRNVAKLADPPPLQSAQVEPLSPADACRVLAAVAGDRLEALYSVALAIGLRRGEIMGSALVCRRPGPRDLERHPNRSTDHRQRNCP